MIRCDGLLLVGLAIGSRTSGAGGTPHAGAAGAPGPPPRRARRRGGRRDLLVRQLGDRLLQPVDARVDRAVLLRRPLARGASRAPAPARSSSPRVSRIGRRKWLGTMETRRRRGRSAVPRRTRRAPRTAPRWTAGPAAARRGPTPPPRRASLTGCGSPSARRGIRWRMRRAGRRRSGRTGGRRGQAEVVVGEGFAHQAPVFVDQ